MKQKQVIKVLGLDASTVNIGWAIVSYHQENLIASGVISPTGDFYERLGAGPRLVFNAVKEYMDDDTKVLAIEHVFFTNNPMVGKQISYMVGACCCIFKPRINHIEEISPQEWKKATVGKGNAQKEEIQRWVNCEYGLSLKSFDECDAIGIATGYIKLHKQGHFKHKKEVKQYKNKQRAVKKAAKKAAKTQKPLKGELDLWHKETE